MEYNVASPLALIVFNRPEHTKKVFEMVKKVRPKKLFIIADGARANRTDDVEKCRQVREIFNNIDWECQIYRNYSEYNLGCGMRPYTGISWVFKNVERAIILEDDCVPNISFFRFCDELLDRYANDERIMLISGTNPLGEWRNGDYSYHYSIFGGIHGWASWNRAWKLLDLDIKEWNNPIIREHLRKKLGPLKYNQRCLIYNKLVGKSICTTMWDYQWGFTRLINNGLAIAPNVNLISNIGFGKESTHTKNSNSNVANLKTKELKFPLIHPNYVMSDKNYDDKLFYKVVAPRWRLFLSYIKTILLGKEKNKLGW